MDHAREHFWEDDDSEENVHIRDRLQFELKSEFSPQLGMSCNEYVQEFYLFIPNSLQINTSTYSKSQFYLDQTNLIRYKTPEFTFDKLLDLNNPLSPLSRVVNLCSMEDTIDNRQHLADELKLLGNVVRSTLRKEIKELIGLLEALKTSENYADFQLRFDHLYQNINQLLEVYSSAEQKFLSNWNDRVFYKQLLYINQFLKNVITHYFTGLLESLRWENDEKLKAIDDKICNLLLIEKEASDSLNHAKKSDENTEENYVYRYGLLNKFVLDALSLSINRFTLEQRYQHWIGGFSAGLAMLLYISLFIWLGHIFVIDSILFILLTVVTYILKDRIKEWLRSFSYIQASRWFPDYTTQIKTPDHKSDLGTIRESFTFLDTNELSQEIKDARNIDTHNVLETYQRPETVIFYKRIVTINEPLQNSGRTRRNRLNVIFRFNIHRLLLKASDPIERHLLLDTENFKLIDKSFPKVYHLNLIIFSTIHHNGHTQKTTKKLRIIIDKKGIKRIEPILQPALY